MVVVNDNQTKVKLTDGELLSLYLTAQQKGDQSIFPDSDSPRITLIKHGFQLDKIEGRPGMAKTRYNFSEGTLQAIEKHVVVPNKAVCHSTIFFYCLLLLSLPSALATISAVCKAHNSLVLEY